MLWEGFCPRSSQGPHRRSVGRDSILSSLRDESAEVQGRHGTCLRSRSRHTVGGLGAGLE